MKVSKASFNWAAGIVKLPPEKRDQIWKSLKISTQSRSYLNFGVVAYYVGAILIICAMGWFLNDNIQSFKGLQIVAIAVVYALIFSGAGNHLYFRKSLKIPGGVLFTVAACMAPIAIYGILKTSGRIGTIEADVSHTKVDISRLIHDRWNDVLMGLGAIAASLFTLRFVRFAFLAAPTAYGLGYVADNLFAIWEMGDFERNERVYWGIFGIAMIILAAVIDKYSKEDYAFWFYLVGVADFWIYVCVLDRWNEGSVNHIIFLVNIVLILLGVMLRRHVFFVFGSAGIVIYLYYLAEVVFEGSQLFPIVVSLAGFMVIFAGINYFKNRSAIDAFATRLFPWRARLVRERTGG